MCSLAHAAADDDSVVNWVEKSRRIQKDKDEAKKRAEMLEEMDVAFGVKDLVTAELIKQKAYTSRDLQGIKVEHGRVSHQLHNFICYSVKMLLLFC